MTRLRKDAYALLDKIPEDKLIFVIQIMQGVAGLYDEGRKEKEEAFEHLESMRRKADHVDYDAELSAYREEKYGFTDIG